MAFIYKITNDVNGKVYIGKTLRSVEKRWKEHIKDSKREHIESRPLYRAMNKYGIDNFRIETIEECSDELVEEREVFWIKGYNSFGKNGYNATIGGDGQTHVHRALILLLWLGNMTSKQIVKFTGYDLGKVRDILKSYGITTEELKERGKEHHIQPVAMYNLDGEHIKNFKSISEACAFVGTDPRHTHIGCVCMGKRKSAHGYVWKYL